MTLNLLRKTGFVLTLNLPHKNRLCTDTKPAAQNRLCVDTKPAAQNRHCADTKPAALINISTISEVRCDGQGLGLVVPEEATIFDTMQVLYWHVLWWI